MNSKLTIAIAAMYAALVGLAGTQAAEFAKQNPTEVIVQLGTKGGDLVVTPTELKLQKGKLYKLIVTNPSNVTHYLSVPEFGTVVQSSEIGVQGGEINRTGFQNPRATLAPSVANLSFKVQAIEVWPGGMAEWTFTPVQSGRYKMGCGVPAHTQAGMAGHILVN